MIAVPSSGSSMPTLRQGFRYIPLPSSPPNSVFCIFNDDSRRDRLRTNRIRELKITRFSCSLHLIELLLDLFVRELGSARYLQQLGADFFFVPLGARPFENCFHFRLIVIFQHAEYLVERGQRTEQRLHVVLADFISVERGVDFAQHVKQGGLRLGRVEIAVAGALYFVDGLLP